jgi:hypothetical protein
VHSSPAAHNHAITSLPKGGLGVGADGNRGQWQEPELWCDGQNHACRARPGGCCSPRTAFWTSHSLPWHLVEVRRGETWADPLVGADRRVIDGLEIAEITASMAPASTPRAASARLTRPKSLSTSSPNLYHCPRMGGGWECRSRPRLWTHGATRQSSPPLSSSIMRTGSRASTTHRVEPITRHPRSWSALCETWRLCALASPTNCWSRGRPRCTHTTGLCGRLRRLILRRTH